MRAHNRHSNACAKQMIPNLRSHYGILLFIHATYIFSHRGEDGHSVGTSPFGDTTCGVGSPIRLHIFQANTSLITVIYWRQTQASRKPYFLTIPTKRARKQQRRTLLCNSCFLQCSIRGYCISLVSSLPKEGRNKDNPSEWGEETLLSKKRCPARSTVLRTPWFGPLLTSVPPDAWCPSSKVRVPTTLTSESPALTGAVQHPPHFCICLSWMLTPEHLLLSSHSTQLPAEIISTTHELQPRLGSCFSIKPTPLFLSSNPSLCKGWGFSNPAWGDFLWPTRR